MCEKVRNKACFTIESYEAVWSQVYYNFLYGDVLLMHVFLAAIRRNAYEWYFTCTSNSEVTIATTGKIQLTLIPL